MKLTNLKTIKVEVQSFDSNILNNNIEILCNCINIFNRLNNTQISIKSMPLVNRRITVLKSPHIDKKARNQFEIRFYKKFIYINFNKFSWIYLKQIIEFINLTCVSSLCKMKFLH